MLECACFEYSRGFLSSNLPIISQPLEKAIGNIFYYYSLDSTPVACYTVSLDSDSVSHFETVHTKGCPSHNETGSQQ